MGERRALVITSQCEGLNLLSFLPDAARGVAEALLDPEVGGCVPALADGRALLVDPTAVELDDAITTALARASEDEATLFIALVGHGEYTYDDFYYLARDTTLPPTSRTAFLLAQRIRELLTQHSLLDGLVLLLDTCHAGIAADQAAARWTTIVGQAGRRFEVLTASDDRVAANGCFSRQLVSVLRSGHPKYGERLRCPDMKTVLTELCPAQTAIHLAFDGRRAINTGDEGLWLAMNTSEVWRGSPAADNPAAAEIDRLTRDFEPTPELSAVVGNLLMGVRYIAVTGPRGKSQLFAALARPSVAEGVIPPKLLHAVVFLTATDTAERVASELARQLDKNVPGFVQAGVEYRKSLSGAVLEAADAFERAVGGPIRTMTPPQPIRIAVDGVDNVAEPLRGRVLFVLESLVAIPGVQLVLSSRDFLPAHAIVRMNSLAFPQNPYSGGTRGDGPEAPANPVLEVLAAAGHQAHIPLTVLVAASAELGGPATMASVRDMVVQLGPLVDRRNAGADEELVALSTDAGSGTARAHNSIANALSALAPVSERDSGSPEQLYADAREPEHLWQAGRKQETLASLELRGSLIPANNRDVWGDWSHRIADSEGASSPLAVVAQARYATSEGKAGNRGAALAMFRTLLPLAKSVLDPADPEIFSIRNNIGYLLFELEQFVESWRELQSLVEDAAATLSPQHEETLHARHMHAIVVGKRGDAAESARLSLEMLPDIEDALGRQSEIAINARLNYVFWTRENDVPPPDVLAQRRLLAQQVAGLRDDDPWAIDVGFIVAVITNDQEALASLLRRSISVRGEHHPETRKIRQALGG